jgi:hypothetical protein
VYILARGEEEGTTAEDAGRLESQTYMYTGAGFCDVVS